MPRKYRIDTKTLRHWMVENEYSQADLSRITGLSESHISNVLKHGEAADGFIARLERAIGVSIVMTAAVADTSGGGHEQSE